MRKTKDVNAEDENGIHIGPVLQLHTFQVTFFDQPAFVVIVSSSLILTTDVFG